MARWLSWLERRPVTAEVVGSNPIRVACNKIYGILAQLGEHLPYKQRVIGSSPIGPTIRRRGMTGVDVRHHILSRYGGIGRHKRLKISRGRLRAGSSPDTCINTNFIV